MGWDGMGRDDRGWKKRSENWEIFILKNVGRRWLQISKSGSGT